MYKHYIRLDSENWIIKAFSDGFPEEILETDILLRETDQRHFYLGDFIFSPSLFEGSQPKYRYINNEIITEIKPLTREQKLIPIRSTRNEMLKASDIYMLEDYPVTAEQKVKVLNYRTALRDLTLTVDINNPIYPILEL